MKVSKLTAVLLTVLVAASAVLAVDTYKVDNAHAIVGFSISHMVINDVKGRFKEFEGTVVIDPDANNAVKEAKATIQAKSIDTDNAKRDDHLRSADFFDVEKFPKITFTTKKIEKEGNQQVLVGDFTMHGVTKEIRLPVTVKGPIKDPWGNSRIAIKGSTTINRKEYGVSWNKALDAGGLLVGEEVTIEINAEAVKPEAAK